MCPEKSIYKGRLFRGALLPLEDKVLGIVHMLQDDPIISRKKRKKEKKKGKKKKRGRSREIQESKSHTQHWGMYLIRQILSISQRCIVLMTVLTNLPQSLLLSWYFSVWLGLPHKVLSVQVIRSLESARRRKSLVFEMTQRRTCVRPKSTHMRWDKASR